ncbi:MAG: LysR family transcriptional regulator, partial [Rhodospirillales bacterium]|nr:LysR family transcriptional regulator [Rhodospirillales bacterium]
SQSALTITIHQLEEDIGASLFNRTTRQVNLTVGGENFLPVAQRLLEDFDRAMSDARVGASRRSGRVDIAVLPSVAIRLMPGILERLHESNPGIRVVLRDDNARGVHRQVRHNEVDFGISNLWQPSPELQFTPLTRDRFGLVCRADHPLAREQGPVSWRELQDSPLFIMAADTGVYTAIQAAEALPDWVRSPAGEVLAMVTLVEMIRAGLGITVLPELAEPSHSDPALAFRKLVNPTVEREICIVSRKNHTLSPAAKTAWDMIFAYVPRSAEV